MPPDTVTGSPYGHPRRDDKGHRLPIVRPSLPTPLNTWSDPHSVACVVPGGLMPDKLHGVSLSSWTGVSTATEWGALTALGQIEEPPMESAGGHINAAGSVIREAVTKAAPLVTPLASGSDFGGN